MDDTELTKKAVEELLRNMNGGKEKDGLPTERKKNPLGKPNKRFLGRTINSMIKHNKRQSESNYRRCQRKLKELDAKQKNCVRRQTHRNHERIRRRSKTESSHEDLSSDSEGKKLRKKKKHKNVRKIKRKKKKQKSSSSSSSNSSASSSSSDSESSCSTNPSKLRKYKNSRTNRRSDYSDNEENEDELYSESMQRDPSVGYYIDPHMAYAALAYGHINHVLQQQQLVQQQTIKDELEESVEIPSDLSISYHSESSLNISLHSSSAEEDENGILTFKLLSSDEECKSPNSKKINAKRKERNENQNIVTLLDSEDTDQDSVKSYISLKSTTSQIPNRETNEIVLLSSSTSDCDDLELIETVSESKPTDSNVENTDEQQNESLVENVTKSNIGEIESTSSTKANNTAKEKQGAEIMSELPENEEIDNSVKYEQSVQIEKQINENKLRYNFETAERNESNEGVTQSNINSTPILDKQLQELEDYKLELKDTNKDLNRSRTPEDSTNTTMIDLTEE